MHSFGFSCRDVVSHGKPNCRKTEERSSGTGGGYVPTFAAVDGDVASYGRG